MRELFLLLDPGLLVPPPRETSASDHHAYWLRLIEWSADRRLRLGRRGQQAVLEILGTDWPNPSPPRCPHGMKREASRALNVLLGAVVTVPDDYQPTGRVDASDPRYVKDGTIEVSLRADIAEQHELGLTGTATSHEHWSKPATELQLSPGPPKQVAIVTAPGTVSDTERDRWVSRRISKYRLTIVGGVAKETVYKELKSNFGMDGSEVRWIETEKSRGAPLDRLKGMQAESDIVFCVTGWIGHAESQKVVELSAKCGVKCVCVEKRSGIIDGLREHFGG